MPAQKMLGRRDLQHPVQFLIEGTGPTNYARSLSAGTFRAPFQLSEWEVTNSPEFIDNFFSGDIDRRGVIQVWEANSITVRGRVLNNNLGLGLLDWAMNKPPLTYQDSKTDNDENRRPHQSRTWLSSSADNAGKINYFIAKGCIPSNANITFPNKREAMLEIVMDVQSYYRVKSTTNATNPPPTTETALTAAVGVDAGSGKCVLAAQEDEAAIPLRFQDLGDFYYKPRGKDGDDPSVEAETLQFRDMNLGIDWTLRRQDSNGLDRTTYLDQASRMGTGSISMYKKGFDLNEDARLADQHTAWMNIERKSTTEAHAKVKVGGTTNELWLFGAAPGKLGAGISLTINAANATGEVKVEGKNITITPKTGALQMSAIKAQLEANPKAAQLACLAIKGTASTNLSVPTTKVTTPSSGTGAATDTIRKIIFQNFRFQSSWESMRGDSDATIETKNIEADSVTAVGKL